ncbi:MAG: NrtA/SsuA/CpmA family ABC transporter substrate-binding protein [Thalassobaculaceae bacterium]
MFGKPGTTRRSRDRRRFHTLFVGLLFCAALAAGSVIARPATAEPFRISASATGILVWVAQDLGLFEENGVDVEVSTTSSGVAALNQVQSGEIDLGTSSEFAFISRAIEDPGLCIYATISASRTVRLLSRADRVGDGAAALRGKRIGVTFGAAARFFLWQYLTLAGVDEDDVTLVNLKPAELIEGMVAGTIDAAIVWEPHATKIQKGVTAGVIEYPDQSDQHYYFTLQGKCGLAESKPEELRAVLSALIAAERVSINQPEVAQQAFAARFGLEAADASAIWALHSLTVSLPQDLLFLMELQSTWRRSSGLDGGAELNVLDRIKTEPLADVAPNAVQIIR